MIKNFLYKLKQKLPQTYWGFPVLSKEESLRENCAAGFSQKKEAQEKKGKKGVSLLFALITIALMMTFIADLIVSTSVNVELAASTRDKVKAEYLAKSGLNAAIFLLSTSWGIDLFSEKQGLKKRSDDLSSLWTSFNTLPPIGAKTVELAKSFGFMGPKKEGQKDADPLHLAGIMNEKVSNLMKLFEDSFSVEIFDESSKINISEMLTRRRNKDTIGQLVALFSCPAEKEFLNSKNVTPEELAYRIFDFVAKNSSSESSPESGFGDIDSPYQKHNPPYKAKRLPLDSIDELKLIEGWDDEIHAVFAPYLTVYPYPPKQNPGATNLYSKININTAPRELLGCLVKEALRPECAENFVLKMNEKISKGASIVDGPADIGKTLKDLLCFSGVTDKDQANPETWFDNKSSVFRVRVRAEAGNQELELSSVIRRIPPKDTTFLRNTQNPKRSYDILYMKVL